MNRYFDYENRKYWDENIWKDTISPIFGLVKWIGSNKSIEEISYTPPDEGKKAEELSYYDRKTNAVNIPEVVRQWKERGVHYECRSQGGCGWLIMCPDRCLQSFEKKLPVLVVFHTVDLTDPYWAMKTLEKYQAYNDMVAAEQDKMIFYICTNGPDRNRIYVNILQEGFVFVPGDVEKVYLDVSAVYQAGARLSEIPDFIYRDEKGVAVDADHCVSRLGQASVPVLDITARWENKTSLTRDQVAMGNWGNARYDFQKVLYSESGRKMAEGIALEYKYNRAADEDFLEYWDKMGIVYENHETAFRRWKAALPKSAFEDPEEKIPVICVMQEVNHANEHLAVTEASYFYEYFRICAQGECILINFVLEDADSNELLADILEEAQQYYPMMDSRRVYIAGHSHNGHYALEFAYRHPDLITAVATYGDPPWLANMGITPMTEERAREVAAYDIPVINLDGMCEAGSYFPMYADGRDYLAGEPKGAVSSSAERIAGWQLRLKASNCPMRSPEEITAARYSDERAVRELGIPGDRSQVVWMDGFELYIVEIKNKEGKFHLCMVGEEGMPHNTTPNQQLVSWNFLRRFARDPETGKIIEL